MTSLINLPKPVWSDCSTDVKTCTTVAEAIKLAKLDWIVEPRIVGIADENGGNYQAVPNCFYYVRSDTKALMNIRTPVGIEYMPLQNVQAFDWFDYMIQEELVTFDSAGSFKGGKVIYIVARINVDAFDVGSDDDLIYPYLVLFNSHDSSLGMGFMFTSIRVICQNTLYAALRQASYTQRRYVFKHTTANHNKFTTCKTQINFYTQNLNVLQEEYVAMAYKEITADDYRAYLEKLFAQEISLQTTIKKERSVTRVKAYEPLMTNFVNGTGLGITSANAGTVWHGYNLLTDLFSHGSESSKKTDERVENRAHSLFFGSEDKKLEKAHELALALV
jgi:phage/plasmid-like protein (TIGR03299 family)